MISIGVVAPGNGVVQKTAEKLDSALPRNEALGFLEHFWTRFLARSRKGPLAMLLT